MVKYEIMPSTINHYIYKKPLIQIDESGELGIVYRNNDKGIAIKRVTLLNLVGCCDKGNLVSYEPMYYVNKYLLSHHLDDSKLESDQLSRALAHYFTFVIGYQEVWDSEYDEDTYNELYDEPRPRWDYFPKRKSERLTYLYNRSLKNLVLNEVDESLRMARTTATAYMSIVINFYKHHMRYGYQFNNPPFKHEMITLSFQSDATNMQSNMKKDIHTTDLRLNFSKSKRNDGGTLGDTRRDLRPFTNKEWLVIENILIKRKRIIKNVKGEMKMQALAKEYSLGFLICRYTGMRREEMASLHLGQIVKPVVIIRNGKEQFEKPFLKIGIGGQYGSLTKTKEFGNKSRQTIIPSVLMNKLYQYTESDRYKKRLAKFRTYCINQIELGNNAMFTGDDAIDKNKSYLFISQNGIPLMSRPSDFTARWVEIRNTVNASEELTTKVLGSTHNLRSTFAINLFRKLLKKMSNDEALSVMSSLLGHEDLKTTLEYLKIAENLPVGDEIYEDTLDYLGIFEGLEGLDNITPTEFLEA